MLTTILTVFHVLAAVGLIAAVLLMSGRSAGLAGAVGGGAERLFGKKRGMDQTLARYATVLGAAFLLTALILSAIYS